MEKSEKLPPRHSEEKSPLQEIQDETESTARAPSRPRSLESADKTSSATTLQEGEDEYVKGVKLFVVIMAVTAACFVMMLDTSIVVTAIPRITTDFHSLSDIGWYGSAYLLASSALQPMAGKLFSQFHSKWTFILFLALFELGSLLCGVARSSKMLIVGRAVSGMGGSGLVNGALTIIAASVPLYKRALYLGIMMGISQLGILFGPLIGGAFTEYASWRWCFYINLPIGGIVIGFLCLIHIPDKRVKSQVKTNMRDILDSLDLPGFGIFAPASIMFLLALEWGGTKYSWNSSVVIGLFCGSAGTFAAFLAWEYRRGDTAMIPLSMLKQRIIWCACLTQLFMGASMIVTSFYMAIYFQTIRGNQPMLSGVYTLPGILSQIIGAVMSGILVGRLGYYLPWSIAGGAVASVGSGLLSIMTPTTPTVQWIFYQAIAGIGRGWGLQMPIVAIQNTLKPELNSVGMSAVMFTQGFGAALFLSFAQTILTNGLNDALPKFAPEVDAGAVIAAGATGMRDVVGAASLRGVSLAYNQAVNHDFYLVTGAAVGGLVFCTGLGWKSVKKVKAAVPSEA